MEPQVHHRYRSLTNDPVIKTGLTCDPRSEPAGQAEAQSTNWRDVTCPTCWSKRTYGVPGGKRPPMIYQTQYCAEEIYFRGNRSHQCPRTPAENGGYCRQHEAINLPVTGHVRPTGLQLSPTPVIQ